MVPNKKEKSPLLKVADNIPIAMMPKKIPKINSKDSSLLRSEGTKLLF
jgi:hypothetical protein